LRESLSSGDKRNHYKYNLLRKKPVCSKRRNVLDLFQVFYLYIVITVKFQDYTKSNLYIATFHSILMPVFRLLSMLLLFLQQLLYEITYKKCSSIKTSHMFCWVQLSTPRTFVHLCTVREASQHVPMFYLRLRMEQDAV
jgi:hypothetical protein